MNIKELKATLDELEAGWDEDCNTYLGGFEDQPVYVFTPQGYAHSKLSYLPEIGMLLHKEERKEKGYDIDSTVRPWMVKTDFHGWSEDKVRWVMEAFSRIENENFKHVGTKSLARAAYNALGCAYDMKTEEK